MKTHLTIIESQGRQRPWLYYTVSIINLLTPRFINRWLRRRLLRGWQQREDSAEIIDRVNFYCLPDSKITLGADARNISDITLRNTHSRYYFDLKRILSGFSCKHRIGFVEGDILKNPDYPSLIKGRRLCSGRENGVILNLDYLRHFCKPVDPIPFEEKVPKLLFRGEIDGKPARRRFMEMWAEDPLCDLGDTTKKNRSQWYTEMITMEDHFRYQFILTLEGNDVSSALMWVMASNCIPVMPRPTVETWLMHSRLQPGVHYVEISPDFTDVGEKLRYYTEHSEEAKRISEASKAWIEQFSDKKREKIISHLVVEKYLRLIEE